MTTISHIIIMIIVIIINTITTIIIAPSDGQGHQGASLNN